MKVDTRAGLRLIGSGCIIGQKVYCVTGREFKEFSSGRGTRGSSSDDLADHYKTCRYSVSEDTVCSVYIDDEQIVYHLNHRDLSPEYVFTDKAKAHIFCGRKNLEDIRNSLLRDRR